MDTELIIISGFCSYSQIEPEFIFNLEEVGLIDLFRQDKELYLHKSQLRELERYARWHYELDVNAEGIDVIQNLVDRIHEMQNEIAELKNTVKLFEDRWTMDIEDI